MAGRNINDFGSTSVTERRWGFIQTWIWKVEEVSYQVLWWKLRLYFLWCQPCLQLNYLNTPVCEKQGRWGARWGGGTKSSLTWQHSPRTVVKLAASKGLLDFAAVLCKRKKKRKKKTTFALTSPHRLMNPWSTGVITYAWRTLILMNTSIFNIQGKDMWGQRGQVLRREKITMRWRRKSGWSVTLCGWCWVFSTDLWRLPWCLQNYWDCEHCRFVYEGAVFVSFVWHVAAEIKGVFAGRNLAERLCKIFFFPLCVTENDWKIMIK